MEILHDLGHVDRGRVGIDPYRVDGGVDAIGHPDIDQGWCNISILPAAMPVQYQQDKARRSSQHDNQGASAGSRRTGSPSRLNNKIPISRSTACWSHRIRGSPGSPCVWPDLGSTRITAARRLLGPTASRPPTPTSSWITLDPGATRHLRRPNLATRRLLIFGCGRLQGEGETRLTLYRGIVIGIKMSRCSSRSSWWSRYVGVVFAAGRGARLVSIRLLSPSSWLREADGASDRRLDVYSRQRPKETLASDDAPLSQPQPLACALQPHHGVVAPVPDRAHGPRP